MNNLKNNNGVTLIELLVAVAILALLGTAIVGIMGSNTAIFRKNKADMGVQTSAEETYNSIHEDIMQAKYIYIEGYTSSADLTFSNQKVGDKATLSLTPIKLLKTNDQKAIALWGNDCENKIDFLCKKENSVEEGGEGREKVASNYRATLNNATKEEQFDSLWKSLRYMDSVEARNYGKFLDYVQSVAGGTSFTAFDDSSLKSESSGVYTFKNVYITKIIVQYAVPVDDKYVLDATKKEKYTSRRTYTDGLGNEVVVEEDKDDYDSCICEYNFNMNKITYSKNYSAMEGLNPGAGDDNTYATNLNYLVSDSDSTKGVSGAVAKFDGSNECIELTMYFNDKNRVYKSDGMTYLRNSFVLHDAK